MSSRVDRLHAEQRLALLEAEAGVQRAELAVTLASLEHRRAIEWAGKVANLGLRLLSMPRVRWLIAANVLGRLKRKWTR